MSEKQTCPNCGPGYFIGDDGCMHSPEQIRWLSSWLAGEGFVWKPGIMPDPPEQLVLTRKVAIKTALRLIQFASGTSKIGIRVSSLGMELTGASHIDGQAARKIDG